MMFGSAKLRKDLCFIFICSKSLPLESINGDVETVNPCVLVPCKEERHRLQEIILDRREKINLKNPGDYKKI